MASKELQLVSRIIHTGDLQSVVEWGITMDDFITSEGRGYFSHIIGYNAAQATSGSVTGVNYFQGVFPNFQRCDDQTMTTHALCFEVRGLRLASNLRAACDACMTQSELDITNALATLSAEVTRLNGISSAKATDLTGASAAALVMRTFNMREAGIDTSICPYPWKPFNDEAFGIQSDEYIVLYGRPKSKKSWVLSYWLKWVIDCGKRVLVYTKEMSGENLAARTMSCMAEIEYSALRAGKLTNMDKCKLQEAQDYLDSHPDQVIFLSGQDAEGGDTIPWLQAKIEKYKPDIVFIDGLYLMTDVGKAKDDHARVRNLSRSIRQTILRTKIPVIATVQGNRAAAKNKKANLDEIAFSDAFGQDATLIIRVINEEENSTCQLVVGGAREFRLSGIRINAVCSTNFAFHSLLTDKEIAQAKQLDDDSAKDPKQNTLEKQARQVKRHPTTTVDAAQDERFKNN